LLPVPVVVPVVFLYVVRVGCPVCFLPGNLLLAMSEVIPLPLRQGLALLLADHRNQPGDSDGPAFPAACIRRWMKENLHSPQVVDEHHGCSSTICEVSRLSGFGPFIAPPRHILYCLTLKRIVIRIFLLSQE